MTIKQWKLSTVSPDFPEKPWFRGTNTLLRFFFSSSNRKLLRSPPSCLLPFHVRHYQSASVENTNLVCVMRSCVWCPEGIHTYQRRWQRIISLSVMEDNTAVKTVFFPDFGWKCSLENRTQQRPTQAEVMYPHVCRFPRFFFFLSISFPPHKASRATSSMILWVIHTDTERMVASDGYLSIIFVRN